MRCCLYLVFLTLKANIHGTDPQKVGGSIDTQLPTVGFDSAILCLLFCWILHFAFVFVDKDEDGAVTSRERVADFISGVMQAQTTASSAHSDSGVDKYEFTVHDDYDADHFYSLFCIVKNITSGHGFVI